MGESFPVVDFQKLYEQEDLNKLREACEKCGCFRIINHSIPVTLMADTKSVAKYLHELPTEIKKRNAAIIPDSGCVPSTATSPLYEGLGYMICMHHPNLFMISPLNWMSHPAKGMEQWKISQYVKQRVLCKETTTCFSFGAFMLASRDGNVGAPKGLVDPDHPRIYRPFKYEDLRVNRISTEKRTGELLDQFRIAA